MRLRWLRCLVAAVLAEITAILTLVSIVVGIGLRNPEGAMAYAEGFGRFVGPVAGALFATLVGYFVARPLRESHVRHGALFGVLFAFVDFPLLAFSQAPIDALFVVSTVGRVGGGILGARLASGGSGA